LDVMEVDAKERKIYDLVVKRFLSVLLPPCEYENQVIKIDIGGEIFQTSGNRIIKSGWKAIKMDTIDSIDTDNLEVIKEDIKKGEKLDIQDLKMTEGKTKPPAFFNEASLLSAMENPVKYMQDSSNELKKVIEDTGGIGTVATRADIIEKLFNGFLIEKKGKDIFITGRGKQLLGFVPEDLKSPIMTAKWEKRLKNIEMGKDKKDIFLEEMKLYTRSIIKEIKESSNKFVHDNLTGTRCPECNKFMLEVNGKKGKMYVCQDRECGYRQKIAVFSDSRCPECKKKLSLYGEGDKSIYVCSCGFKEKKKSFDERRKKDNKNLSKKEVQNYLKSQNSKSRKEDINNPMFEALSKLKFDKE